MRPVFFRALALLVLLCSTSLASEALVIRDDGYWLLTSQRRELVKLGCVIDQRTGAPKPEDPNPGEPTDRAKQIADLSRDVGTHEEAVTMAAVMRSLTDQNVSGKVAWDAAFQLVLNRVSGDISPKWQEWKTKVEALAGDYSAQFFADVATGITLAHDLDRVALEAVADGSTDVDLGLGRKEITLPEILALIKLIIQLLNDLGILNR